MLQIKKYDFINQVTVEKAKHEILIEKEELRKEALLLIYSFIKS